MTVIFVQSIHSNGGRLVVSGGSLVKDDIVEIRLIVGSPPECVGEKLTTSVQESPITSPNSIEKHLSLHICLACGSDA